jgi:site-specific DNA-cytosine methylase
MKTMELFSGTKSFSKVAKNRGHSTFTIDNDSKTYPDMLADIYKISMGELPYRPDVLWASPPCTCYSVASIGKHWGGGKEAYIPKTKEAIESNMLIVKLVQLIDLLNPKFFFIENPRGVLRKLNLIPYSLKTCCYCQYGDTRMKPTDIWTNLDNWVPKMCHNGCKDHEEARRGAKTGTQGLKSAKERGVVPERLLQELFNVIEG